MLRILPPLVGRWRGRLAGYDGPEGRAREQVTGEVCTGHAGRGRLWSDPRGDDAYEESVGGLQLDDPASCHQWGLAGGQPVAGRLWTVQHRVARVNLLHVP